jgi:hypothetical protein
LCGSGARGSVGLQGNALPTAEVVTRRVARVASAADARLTIGVGATDAASARAGTAFVRSSAGGAVRLQCETGSTVQVKAHRARAAGAADASLAVRVSAANAGRASA